MASSVILSSWSSRCAGTAPAGYDDSSDGEAGVTEELKMKDQLRWDGLMIAIKVQVEEIIWNEIIYW